jgi:hypothetical protein
VRAIDATVQQIGLIRTKNQGKKSAHCGRQWLKDAEGPLRIGAFAENRTMLANCLFLSHNG